MTLPRVPEGRTAPGGAAADYFHLVDLNEFVKQRGRSGNLVILDYGAGDSPYKSYFPGADYRRADLPGHDDLRYHISHDSKISEQDEMFDLILSTQVAEHVPDPATYFKECYRLLKKGGELLLTTHGVWDEHGAPFDFQRWTASGLNRDLTSAGFLNPEIWKITCGLRAAIVICTRALYSAAPPSGYGGKFGFKLFRWIYSRLLPLTYNRCDKWWPEQKFFKSTANETGPVWYIVIAAIARK